MSTVPQFGYMLPSREYAVVGEINAEPLLELAELCEDLGFDSVWISDSPLGRTRIDGLVLMAAAAARLKRAAIGSAVLIAALRNPLLLASMLASIERIAPGRLTIGVGSGAPGPATDNQYKVLGIDPRRRIGRASDAVATCKALWQATSEIEFESDFYTSPAAVSLDELKPSTPAGPAFWLGGSSRTAQLAVARRFDGWMPYVQNPSELSQGLDFIRERAALHGRDPEPIAAAFVPTILLASPEPDWRERFLSYCHRYYDASPEQVLKQRPGMFVGEADDCLAWLSRFIDAGATQIIVRIAALDHVPAEVHRVRELIIDPLRTAYTTSFEGPS